MIEPNRQASTEPFFRGRKLVLNYTDGSPCEPRSDRLLPRKLNVPDDDDDDDDDEDDRDDNPKGHKGSKSKEPIRR